MVTTSAKNPQAVHGSPASLNTFVPNLEQGVNTSKLVRPAQHASAQLLANLGTDSPPLLTSCRSSTSEPKPTRTSTTKQPSSIYIAHDLSLKWLSNCRQHLPLQPTSHSPSAITPFTCSLSVYTPSCDASHTNLGTWQITPAHGCPSIYQSRLHLKLVNLQYYGNFSEEYIKIIAKAQVYIHIHHNNRHSKLQLKY